MPLTLVGTIGLNATPFEAGWAKLAHVPYLTGSTRYEIADVPTPPYLLQRQHHSLLLVRDLRNPSNGIESVAFMTPDSNINLIAVFSKVKRTCTLVRAAMKNHESPYRLLESAGDCKLAIILRN
jgi:hypothetical protein